MLKRYQNDILVFHARVEKLISFVHLAVDAQTKARDDFDHSVRNFAGANCMIQLKLCSCVILCLLLELCD